MLIQTSRFGPITLSEDDVIEFPEGILGFNNLRKFVLLDDPNDEIFAWLQSCELPAIAFPILEPELFSPGYQVNLTKHDLEALKLNSGLKSRYFAIITIPDDPTQMTANLKAPIVINVTARLARQCVLQDNHLAIREPIFIKLQQRIVQNPTSSIKSQALDWGVAIRLPEAGAASGVSATVAAGVAKAVDKAADKAEKTNEKPAGQPAKKAGLGPEPEAP